jgi:rhamnose transport system permease protein
MTAIWLRRALPYLPACVLLFAAIALVGSQTSRPAAVLNMWRPWGEIGALAAVMTAIVLTGGIDLSVGSIIALSSVCFGLSWQAGWPLEWCAAAAVAVGFAAGAINGKLITLGIAPLVATLATMAFYAGLAMALSQGERVAGLPESFTVWGQNSWLELPNQFWLFAVAWLAAWIVVHHTRFGRYLYAIGENRLAAEFAAVPVRSVEWALYAASGTLAALVALVYTARGGAVVPNAGAGIELQTIACVVLGGTRVTGGWGGLFRTLVGVAIMSLLDIGLQFVSRKIYLPWSDMPWQFNANARLVLVGVLVMALPSGTSARRRHATGERCWCLAGRTLLCLRGMRCTWQGCRLDLRFPVGPILATPQCRDGGIALRLAGRRIEIHGMARAVGDVSQLAQERAFVTFFDVGIWPAAGTDAIEKIPQMRVVAVEALAFGGELLAGGVEDLVVAAIEDHRSIIAVEGDAKGRTLEAMAMPVAAFPGDRLVAEIIRDHLRVGRFLVIVEEVFSAAGRDAARVVDPQAPAADVERMDAVVAQLAGAPMPEPVPIVGHDVVAIFALGRRTLPQGVVQTVGNRRRLAATDRFAVGVVPTARKKHAADLAGFQSADGLDRAGHAATLRADLHDTGVLAGGGHHPFAFTRVVAGRFFYVDVLAGRAGHDRGRTVPVVGRGNHHGIDGWVVKDASQIAHPLGRQFLLSVDGANTLVERTLVDVADAGDACAAQRGEAGSQRRSTTVGANDAQRHGFTRTVGGPQCAGRGHGRTGGDPCRLLEKRATGSKSVHRVTRCGWPLGTDSLRITPLRRRMQLLRAEDCSSEQTSGIAASLRSALHEFAYQGAQYPVARVDRAGAPVLT